MSSESVTSTVGRSALSAPAQTTASRPNVGDEGRVVSLMTGLGLTFYGLHRGSWLGAASFLIGASLLHRGWTGYCALYEQLGIDSTDNPQTQRPQSRPGVRAQHGRKIVAKIEVNRDRRDVYDFWRNFQNLPRVMRHLKSVTPIDDARSRWSAHAPLGQTLSWEAEIINERPGELIAWQSIPGSQVDTAGSVHLSDSSSGMGTQVTVTLKYDPPGGHFVDRLAHLLGQGLEDDLREDLRAFKTSLESTPSAEADDQQSVTPAQS